MMLLEIYFSPYHHPATLCLGFILNQALLAGSSSPTEKSAMLGNHLDVFPESPGQTSATPGPPTVFKFQIVAAQHP